jgi:hypothetical protein
MSGLEGSGIPSASGRVRSIPCFSSVAGRVLKGQVELVATWLHAVTTLELLSRG